MYCNDIGQIKLAGDIPLAIHKFKRSFFFTGSSNWGQKAAVTKPLKQTKFCFKMADATVSTERIRCFLSRSVDISTTKMSYNVNSPAFYELKEDIYTIIVVKEQSTTIGSVANAVLQVQPQLTSDRLGTRSFTA